MKNPEISPGVVLHLDDVQMDAVRAGGAGGQNVNKVSSAIHLRFDIHAARLPERLRQRLLRARDSRVTGDGVLVLKAQRFRTQALNRDDALERLLQVLREASREAKPRRATRPTRSSQRKRLEKKVIHGKNKALRRKPNIE